jgi:hypothetical protein
MTKLLVSEFDAEHPELEWDEPWEGADIYADADSDWVPDTHDDCAGPTAGQDASCVEARLSQRCWLLVDNW